MVPLGSGGLADTASTVLPRAERSAASQATGPRANAKASGRSIVVFVVMRFPSRLSFITAPSTPGPGSSPGQSPGRPPGPPKLQLMKEDQETEQERNLE